jgi:hypothetical protein
VSKDFTLTPGQISSSSEGFRAAPAVGTLAPDGVFAGGTVALIQAVDTGEFRVQPAGGVQFPGISGNLTVQLPIYLGPNRLNLSWDAGSGWYDTIQEGVYEYFVQRRGLATTMRFSAAPSGTA